MNSIILPSFIQPKTLPPSSLRLLPPSPPRLPSTAIKCSSSSSSIQMFLCPDGSWSAFPPKVVVLWDLDNKPPRHQPYPAAISLRRTAQLFGHVIEISAYANRHAFLHLPRWLLATRRDRRTLDSLERKRISIPDQPYTCGVCGRKFPTNPDLKRHFVQLHERERQKKLGRMRSLKGKKRERYMQRFVSGNLKYEEAARELLVPKRGYGLASELRRAGVFVKTVEDKPQAADAAVKRQIGHSISRGVDCLLLVSDDSDFLEMIGRARAAGLRTVVIGDGRRALGRLADFWVSWEQVENGEVGEDVLVTARNHGFDGHDHEDDDKEDAVFSSSAAFYKDGDDDEWEDDDDDDVIVERFGFGSVKVSGFSEVEKGRRRSGNDISGVLGGANVAGRSLSWTIEEDEDDYYI